MCYNWRMESNKFNKTQKSLFVVYMLRIVLELFTSTFLTSHIVSLNPETALSTGLVNIGIFYISQFFVYGVLYFVISYFVDKSDRITFLRIGILVNTALLVALVFWGEQISHWIFLAGALCGISDAFFYPSYLVMKNEINHRRHIKKFSIMSTIFTNAIKVIVPVLLGFLIDATSYSNIAIYVVMVAVIQLVISFFVKSSKPENSDFEFKKFLRFLKEDKPARDKIKYTYFNALLNGPKNTYNMIIVVLTIYTFKTNLSLGMFTSIFSFATMALLLLFKKVDGNAKINKFAIYLTIGFLPVVSCLVCVFYLNKPTIIIYNFCLTIALYFSDYFGTTERDTIIRSLDKKEFIAEHQLMVESCQNVSKVVSYLLFVIVGLIANITVFKCLLIFMILICPLKFMIMFKQRSIRKEFEIQQLQQAQELEMKNEQ